MGLVPAPIFKSISAVSVNKDLGKDCVVLWMVVVDPSIAINHYHQSLSSRYWNILTGHSMKPIIYINYDYHQVIHRDETKKSMIHSSMSSSQHTFRLLRCVKFESESNPMDGWSSGMKIRVERRTTSLANSSQCIFCFWSYPRRITSNSVIFYFFKVLR